MAAGSANKRKRVQFKRVPFERQQIQQHNQLMRQRKNQALSVDRLIFYYFFKLNIEGEVEGNTIAFATAASCNVRRLFRRTLQRDLHQLSAFKQQLGRLAMHR